MKPEKIQQNSELMPDASQKTAVIHKDEQIRQTYFKSQLSNNFPNDEYSPVQNNTDNKSIIDSEELVSMVDRCSDEKNIVGSNMIENVSYELRLNDLLLLLQFKFRFCDFLKINIKSLQLQQITTHTYAICKKILHF